MTYTDNLYLGFDLSTQQLKVIASDEKLKHFGTYKVDFDSELGSKYGIHKGVISIEETGEIFAPVELWIESLDLVFSKMAKENFPFNRVKGLSGSCQQHGSVYWSHEAHDIFAKLSADKSLQEQLSPKAFTFQTSPNWQDHSTGPELEAFEKAVGGAHELALVTGSRAHYRFTGTQIRKLSTRKDPELYHKTCRISLISSFLSSLLCGEITKIDESDGCGMNLYDIPNSKYDDELLALAAGTHATIDNVSREEQAKGIEEIKAKLGEVEPIGSKPIGKIANYFVSKYGFDSNCSIFPFTGDNNATILSLPLANNDILVSMGTSTTVLLVTDQYKPSENYHIFKHPTIPEHYMGMLCYCNGSLAREKVRDAVNEKYGLKGWDKFNELLDNGKPLNDKEELGVYFSLGEIIPNCKPQTRRYKFDLSQNKLVELDQPWSVEEDVNSIVESQALSCRLRAGPMLEAAESMDENKDSLTEKESAIVEQLSKFGDIKSDGTTQSKLAPLARPNKIFYVGGASQNISIVNKFSSVLGATEGNFKIDLTDACALGGCYKAIWSDLTQHNATSEPYGKWLSDSFNWNEVEELKVKDQWTEYIDGVGILSLIEQTLYT